jgi:hypothetical protein
VADDLHAHEGGGVIGEGGSGEGDDAHREEHYAHLLDVTCLVAVIDGVTAR